MILTENVKFLSKSFLGVLDVKKNRVGGIWGVYGVKK